MKTISAVFLPSILFVAFLRAEASFALYESGVQLLIGAAFVASLIVAVIAVIHFAPKNRKLLRCIVLSFLLASGPFWGDLLGLQPNVHGFSILLWFIYVVVAWLLAAYLIIVAVWRLLKVRAFSTGSG
jgi:hypothetical protein